MKQNFPKLLAVVSACVIAGNIFAQDAIDTTNGVKVQDRPLARGEVVTRSFAPVVQKVAPSVVNVYSTTTVRVSPHPFSGIPFFEEFFGGGREDGARTNRNQQPRTRRQQGLGSGVIISEDGYILTSYHTIEGAEELKVGLSNGGRTMNARVIGTDPPTDIAVIKVEGTELPAITVADSSKILVGDVVLAVGNPFGIGQTVTMGIVSATGRGGFGIVEYEDFIQTDASINPGNSGGALVDAEGRLIGINTAILSRTGASSGVGFAVPSNMARGVMERIIKAGKVVRGYLGVMIQPVTPELAEVFNLPDQSGALVGDVTLDSPAAKAGLKPGDVIRELNGRKVEDNRQLRLMISETAPNTQVNLKVIRDGKERTFAARLGELPTQQVAQSTPNPRPTRTTSIGLGGVDVVDLNSETRAQLEIPSNVRGALVMNVETTSSAYTAGLRPGDVIVEIDGRPVTSAREAVSRTRNAKEHQVLMRVWSEGNTRYVVVENGKAR